MKKRRYMARPLNRRNTPAVLTCQERVKRKFPAARIYETVDGAFQVLVMNGSGNILAVSFESPEDAWKKADQYLANGHRH